MKGQYKVINVNGNEEFYKAACEMYDVEEADLIAVLDTKTNNIYGIVSEKPKLDLNGCRDKLADDLITVRLNSAFGVERYTAFSNLIIEEKVLQAYLLNRSNPKKAYPLTFIRYNKYNKRDHIEIIGEIKAKDLANFINIGSRHDDYFYLDIKSYVYSRVLKNRPDICSCLIDFVDNYLVVPYFYTDKNGIDLLAEGIEISEEYRMITSSVKVRYITDIEFNVIKRDVSLEYLSPRLIVDLDSTK